MAMGCGDPMIPLDAAYCLADMLRGMKMVVLADVERDDGVVSTLT